MARIRTIHQAWQELKAIDPGCCVSEAKIRQLVKAGVLPHSASGRRIYINVDVLLDWLENPEKYEPQLVPHFQRGNTSSAQDVAAMQALSMCSLHTSGGRTAGTPADPAYGIHPIKA